MRRFTSHVVILRRSTGHMVAAAAALALCVGATARADNTYVTSLFDYDDVSNGGTETAVRVAIEGSSLIKTQGRSVRIRLNKDLVGGLDVDRDVYAGIQDLLIQDPKGAAGVRRDFMCVQVDVPLASTTQDYDKYDAFGRVGWLIGQIAAHRADKDMMAGLQIAIWEVAYDFVNGNADDISGGIFSIGTGTSTAIRNAANAFLSSSVGQANRYLYHRSPVPGQTKDYQDLITIIPEPITLAFLAAGGLLTRRRRMASLR